MSRAQNRIYLDHSASTPTDPAVVQAMLPYFSNQYGNASSIHAYGQEAKVGLEQARRQIAKVINAEPAEIVFTSSGTESDNWALKGAAFAHQGGDGHIITSTAEHHAVLYTGQFLEQKGLEVTYLRVDKHGRVAPSQVLEAIRENTFLISLMHANNEVGSLNPISEIGAVARERGILFHTDAVQTFGRLPIDVKEMAIDLLSLSGHKMYGPKGIGALYIRRGLQIEKLLHGGKHERDRRAGTENVPAGVGLGKAAELCAEKMNAEMSRLGALRSKLQRLIEHRIDGVRINSPENNCHPGILNISFDGVQSDSLLLSLDLKGIAVSNGSACTSGSIDPSHVLQAMGLSRELSTSAVRFSLGRQNTPQEINATVDALCEVLGRLRKLGRRR